MYRKITQWIDQGWRWLLPGLQGQTLKRLVRPILSEIQELEDAAWDVLQARIIDAATFEALDAWGALVGEGREGRDDATYRAAIKVAFLRVTSAGTPADLLGIVRALVPDAARILLDELGGLEVRITIYGGTVPSGLRHLVQGSARAGVLVTLVHATTTPLSFVGDPNDAGLGDLGGDPVGGDVATLL